MIPSEKHVVKFISIDDARLAALKKAGNRWNTIRNTIMLEPSLGTTLSSPVLVTNNGYNSPSMITTTPNNSFLKQSMLNHNFSSSPMISSPITGNKKNYSNNSSDC